MMPTITWQPGGAAALVSLVAVAAVAWAWARWGRAPDSGDALRLALRTAALSVLAVAAWRPSLQLPAAAGPPRVTIVIDDSESMAVNDDTRSDADWVRLAEAVGAIPPSARQRPAGNAAELLAGAARALRGGSARGDAAADLDAAAARLRGDPASAGLAERAAALAQQVRRGARRQETRRAAEALAADLRRGEVQADERLLLRDPVVAAAVAALRDASRFDLARRAAASLGRRLPADAVVRVTTLDGSGLSDDVFADATASPLVAAVRAAVRGADAPSALVLLSDGRSTEPYGNVPPALAAANVPVMAVSTAPARRLIDVRVLRIEAPAAVYAGERLSVRVVLRGTLAGGRAVDVTLRGGLTPISEQAVLGGGDLSLTFDVAAGAAPLELIAEVMPLPGEREIANNTAAARVDVLPRRVRVLLVTGGPVADARDLADAVAKTPWCELRTESADAAPPALSPTALAETDLIVLAGVPATALSDAQAQALGDAVARGGKSVLLLAAGAAPLEGYAARPDLAALLPHRGGAAVWRASPGGEPAVLPVPVRGAASLAGETPPASWLARPRLSRLLDLGPLRDGVVALVADRASGAPVVTEHAAGTGRVMCMAVDEIWRWRESAVDVVAGQRPEAFWVTAVRHLVDRPPDAEASGLAVSVGRRALRAGSNLDLRVRAAADATTAEATLRLDGRVVARQSLAALPPGGGRFGGVIAPGQAGAYVLHVAAGGAAVELPLRVAGNELSESDDLTPDPDLLRRIADVTGGAFFTLEDLAAVPDRLRQFPAQRGSGGATPLWCSPLAFGLVVGCLGLEWALRRRAGLA